MSLVYVLCNGSCERQRVDFRLRQGVKGGSEKGWNMMCLREWCFYRRGVFGGDLQTAEETIGCIGFF